MARRAAVVRKLWLMASTPGAFVKLLRLVCHLPVSLGSMLRLSRIGREEGKAIPVVVLINQLGDIIAAEPAARYIAEQTGGGVVWLVCKPYQDVVLNLPYVRDVVPVLCASEWILLRWLYQRLPGLRQYIMHIDGHPCHWFGLTIHNPTRHQVSMQSYYLQGGLLAAFSRQAIDVALDERPHLPWHRRDLDHALTEQPDLARALTRPFATVHFRSNEEERSLSMEQVTTCLNWLRRRGYVIVELGTTPTLTSADDVIHLDHRLPLPAQFAVVAQSQCFIGVDSAFAHVANAHGIPAAVLIGQYAHYTEHIPYSGPWRKQIGVRLIRSPKPVKHLSVTKILTELDLAFPPSPSMTQP
jgi:heptosyltransferase-3